MHSRSLALTHTHNADNTGATSAKSETADSLLQLTETLRFTFNFRCVFRLDNTILAHSRAVRDDNDDGEDFRMYVCVFKSKKTARANEGDSSQSAAILWQTQRGGRVRRIVESVFLI